MIVFIFCSIFAFFSKSCVFLQLLPPSFHFLQLFYSTRFKAHSLVSTYINIPTNRHILAYPPTHSAHPSPPHWRLARHAPLTLLHPALCHIPTQPHPASQPPPNLAPLGPPPHPHRAHQAGSSAQPATKKLPAPAGPARPPKKTVATIYGSAKPWS